MVSDEKLELLEHQTATLLALSSLNLILNIVTILAAVLISWR